MTANRLKFVGSLTNRLEMAKLLSYGNVSRNFDDYFDDYYKSSVLNKDDLLGANLRYAKEDALQQYKTQKKSLILTYLLFIIFWLFFPNYYVGRKRLAKIELGLLITILIALILCASFEASEKTLDSVREIILVVLGCFWVFDLLSLWIVVVDNNYALYKKLLKSVAEKTGFNAPKGSESCNSTDLSPVIRKGFPVNKDFSSTVIKSTSDR